MGVLFGRRCPWGLFFAKRRALLAGRISVGKRVFKDRYAAVLLCGFLREVILHTRGHGWVTSQGAKSGSVSAEGVPNSTALDGLGTL